MILAWHQLSILRYNLLQIRNDVFHHNERYFFLAQRLLLTYSSLFELFSSNPSLLLLIINSVYTMISSLSRHLPRTTASSVASFKCIRPTVGSSPILTSSRAFSSTDTNDDKALSRDAIGEIISAEYGLSMAESKRVVRTVFDTVTEVRFSVITLFLIWGAPTTQHIMVHVNDRNYVMSLVII